MWDLFARRAGKPLWKYLADLPAEQIVAAVDFRHITDALTPDEALAMLQGDRRLASPTREAALRADGYPAYITSAGWLGYPDDLMRSKTREALADGWTALKIKVGRDRDDDMRRTRILREELGPDRRLLIDANQVWDVDEAIDWTLALADADPWWIEEPTSPDDILGHARIAQAVHPIRVATGEHCHNRIMFKQFFQSGGMDIAQIDGCRLGGRERGDRRAAAGGEVRRAGVPARRRHRAVPARAALLDVRLLARVGPQRRPHDRVRRAPARALRHRVARRRAAATSRRPTRGFGLEMKAGVGARRTRSPTASCGPSAPRVADRLRVALVGGPMYDSLYEPFLDDVDVVVHADHPTLNRAVAEMLAAGERIDVLSTHGKYAPSQAQWLRPLERSRRHVARWRRRRSTCAASTATLLCAPRNIDVRILWWRTDRMDAAPATLGRLLAGRRGVRVHRPRVGAVRPVLRARRRRTAARCSTTTGGRR